MAKHSPVFHMSKNSFVPRFVFIYVTVYLWVCLCHRYVGAYHGQKRTSDPLELELLAIELADNGCWEPNLQSSARAGSSLDLGCWEPKLMSSARAGSSLDI